MDTSAEAAAVAFLSSAAWYLEDFPNPALDMTCRDKLRRLSAPVVTAFFEVQ